MNRPPTTSDARDRSGRPSNGIRRKWSGPTAAGLIAVLALVALLRLPMFFDTRQPDKHVFAYVGQVIADGGRPYIDAWDNKPCGIHYVNAMACRLFPYSMPAVLVHETLWILLTGWVVMLVAERVAGIGTSRWAAILFLLTVNLQRLSSSGNLTETYAILPASLGFLAFFSARLPARFFSLPLFLCGAAFALAMQFRITFGTAMVALSLGAFFLSGGWKETRAGILAIFSLWLGFGAGWAAIAGLLAARGILGAYVQSAILANLHYVASPDSWPVHRVVKTILRSGPAPVFGILGACLSLRRGTDWGARTVALCLVADFAGALVSRHWHGHYFLQTVMTSCILAAWCLRRPVDPGQREMQPGRRVFPFRDRPFAAFAILLLFGAAAYYQGVYVMELREEIMRPDSLLNRQHEAARLIMETTGEDESLLCHGQGAITALYFLSHRKASTRYFYTDPFDASLYGEDAPWLENAFTDYMTDLTETSPSIVVVDQARTSPLEPRFREPFATFLTHHYVPMDQTPPFVLWRRDRN